MLLEVITNHEHGIIYQIHSDSLTTTCSPQFSTKIKVEYFLSVGTQRPFNQGWPYMSLDSKNYSWETLIISFGFLSERPKWPLNL